MNRRRSAVERMAAQAVPTDDQVRRAVVAGEPGRTLHRILDDRGVHAVSRLAPARRRWGPVAVVGAAVTAVLAAVAVFVLPGAVRERPLDEVAGPAPAPSVTAVSDPADVLRRLADRADAQPPIPEGRWDYIHTVSWGPPTGPDGWEDVDAADVRRDTEIWRSPEGGRHEQHEEGQLRSVSGIEPAPQVEDLPTEPGALERVLRAQHPSFMTESKPCIAMGWIWSDQVVQPQVQAAFLRLLATTDEVRLVGPVTDRLGRQGVAVEVTERGELIDVADPTGAGGPAVITHTLT
jgi:hypothetical protein